MLMGCILNVLCIYYITIEDNEVYNNSGYGIMFSRNMYDSVARNNYVYNQTNCISVNTQSQTMKYTIIEFQNVKME